MSSYRTQKFELSGAFFVTWSRSKIEEHQRFASMLRDRLPEGTEVYGSKELHVDGSPHYHAVVLLSDGVTLVDARETLTFPGDTEAVRVVTPADEQSMEDFLKKTQAYVAKDDNTCIFGEYIELERTECRCGTQSLEDQSHLSGADDDEVVKVAEFEQSKLHR
jgi:hypothetical protein